MLIKAIILPLVLIICFGGWFVALTKPFNARAVFIILLLVVSLLVLGYTTGVARVIAGLAIVAALAGLSLGRVRR